LLNLAILTELPRDGVVRVFFGLGRLFHCVFDAQRVALTMEKVRVSEKGNPRSKTRKTGKKN
jgi:hypothetical protein